MASILTCKSRCYRFPPSLPGRRRRVKPRATECERRRERTRKGVTGIIEVRLDSSCLTREFFRITLNRCLLPFRHCAHSGERSVVWERIDTFANADRLLLPAWPRQPSSFRQRDVIFPCSFALLTSERAARVRIPYVNPFSQPTPARSPMGSPLLFTLIVGRLGGGT